MREATGDGQLIHAQNWDWKEECSETAAWCCASLREDGPDILTFTEAGMLARSGFNAAGISITGNNLESDRDYRQIGVPLPMIRRKALESPYSGVGAARRVRDAEDGFEQYGRAAITRASPSTSECAPDETFQLLPQNGLLVHSNHWLSLIALSKLKDTGIAFSPCSAVSRAARARSRWRRMSVALRWTR